jgi:hypothetical protein
MSALERIAFGVTGSLLTLFGQTLVFCSSFSVAAYAKETSDPPFEIAKKLANDPHLLSFQYLSSVLGPPNRCVNLRSGFTRRAVWHESQTNTEQYEFQQEVGPTLTRGHVEYKFTVHLPPTSKVDMSALEKAFGSSHKFHYDNKSNPNYDFVMSPSTTVTAVKLTNWPLMNKLVVTYDGPQLSGPTQTEMDEIAQNKRTLAFEHHSKGRHADAIPALSSYLREKPADAEAHFRLAESLKANCHVNEAISEYSLAYRLSSNDYRLQNQCLDGLRALKVLPSTVPPIQPPAETAPASLAYKPFGPTYGPQMPQTIANGIGIKVAPSRPFLDPNYDPFQLDAAVITPVNYTKSIAASASPLETGF